MDNSIENQKAIQYARLQRPNALERLAELLRFKTISSQYEQYQDEFAQCASWLVNQLKMMGMERAEIIPTNGGPLIYAEWLAAAPELSTLLVYGHYDVMPVEPTDEWRHPPFEPYVDGQRIYCRGASDDKGQFFAVLFALEAWLKGAGKLPLNVKVLLEGEEEKLSPNLDEVLIGNQERLRCDGILVADMGGLDPRVPLIMYGTRGNLALEIIVSGPSKDLHSGTYGGGVDNPLNVLTRLIAALQDGKTRKIIVPGFYDRVQELTPRELELAKAVPITDEAGLYLTGAPALAGEQGYPLKLRISSRPTFDIHGIAGGYNGPGIKTVIPSSATAKISFRLVPDQQPEEVLHCIQDYLISLAPDTIRLMVKPLGQAAPLTVDLDHPVIAAAREAYQRSFDASPCYIRGGGSLRIASLFQHYVNPAILLTGFGLPEDNEHAPNESFALGQFYRGAEMVIHYLGILSSEYRNLG
jgi:acetylornithine deacetylase/succinyl-diaminopimelate desuccinylase-like protein